ncbi:MAG: helix-turn-helix domain-containing protein [Luteolibacter sp.]
MNRRAIPRIEMIRYGGQPVHDTGFVAVPLAISMDHDPMRASPHYHDFYQVSVLVGKGTLMHDFRETSVSGVTMFFLSPGQVHAVKRQPGLGGSILSFTRDFIDASGESMLLDLPFFFATDVKPWLDLDAEAGETAMRLFQEIQQEYDAALPGAAEILRSQLRILLVRASRWYEGKTVPVHSDRAAALGRRFQRLIETHFLEWSSLEPYARELGVTVNHLHDVVSGELGYPAGELIRQRRLLDAKRLLLHSSMSVAEICFHLGFKDPSYFGRFFRRYEGMTPVEFRKQIREKYQKGGA